MLERGFCLSIEKNLTKIKALFFSRLSGGGGGGWYGRVYFKSRQVQFINGMSKATTANVTPRRCYE